MDDTTNLYLELLKRALTGLLIDDPNAVVRNSNGTIGTVAESRKIGRDHPENALTMIGLQWLENIQACVQTVLRQGIPGDLVETGVWRGGATIFMRALLKAHGDSARRVWVADSFEGVPPPNTEAYPMDGVSHMHEQEHLRVSLEQVQANFAKYDLLDDQVCFLKGWFKDTLPTAPIQQIAVLRLDGDLYESTLDALMHLYPKLSIGGYVIVDDYGALEMCKLAVDNYRSLYGITAPIHQIDWTGAYWRRTGDELAPAPQLFLEDHLDLPARDILTIIQRHLTHHQTYFGIRSLKSPTDWWTYQEIIYEQRPDIIIEIGNYHGASTLALAHLCDAMDHGRMIAVDTNHAQVDSRARQHPRITWLEGDAVAMYAAVRAEIQPHERVLIIEDSAHTYQNTLNVLRTYSPLIPSGGYFIVEDSNIHHGILGADALNPYAAIEAFLAENPNFYADRSAEAYFITWNPKGYLRRR